MKKISLAASIIGLALSFSMNAAAQQQMFDYNSDGDVSAKDKLRPANKTQIQNQLVSPRDPATGQSTSNRSSGQAGIYIDDIIIGWKNKNASNNQDRLYSSRNGSVRQRNSVVFEGNDEPLWTKGNRRNSANPNKSGGNRKQNLSGSGNRRKP